VWYILKIQSIRGNPNIHATGRKLTRENQRARPKAETISAHPCRRLSQRANTLTQMWMVRPPKPNRLGAIFDIEAGLGEAL
jgi:hypothetical protein